MRTTTGRAGFVYFYQGSAQAKFLHSGAGRTSLRSDDEARVMLRRGLVVAKFEKRLIF